VPVAVPGPVAFPPMSEPHDPLPRSVEWRGDHVRLIDQRQLPDRLVMVDLTTADEVVAAIADLTVRGAPAIGAAAAFGVALAVVAGEDPVAAGARLKAARPTAVNLAWAVDRVLAAPDPVAEAVRLADEDVAVNRAIGAHGAPLVPAGANVLTHCNAGGLATVGYGTAIGVVRAAHEAGCDPHVWVDETRPVLQGARLTAWELQRLGIRATLVPDVMAGSLMASGDVDLVIVGADRIAANGDVANKIGTYGVAVLAHHHGLPFYVAAPCSTHDPATAAGADIPIERRRAEEVTDLGGRRVAPVGVAVENRAFDVTPAALVTAYISELGVRRGSASDGPAAPA
jgi:methylthioribose-1-phosphate isomerase